MGNDSKTWENKNINLGMTKKSEKMLIQDRVTSSCWVEKRRV
jgi:hypothetical protein